MDKVAASHILIKYQGSRRPASHRDLTGARILNTTLEQAMAQMKQIRTDIIEGRLKFDDVARSISDCSSGQQNGSLGTFGRGEMQEAFERVAFSTSVGDLSEPFVSDSGVHIIRRDA
jgi:NIMA-interacting peptidyl-prolyl cis-trans isomerase 1